MLVKPLSRFGQRGYAVGYVFPDTNHRDNKKNKGSKAEQPATDGTSGEPVNPAE